MLHETARERQKRIQAERLAAGLCKYCDNPRPPGNKNFCAIHNKRHLAYSRKWRHEHKKQVVKITQRQARRLQSEGKCIRCGKPRRDSESKWLCVECLERNRQYEYFRTRKDYQKSRYHARRAAGLCARCGKPSRKSICDECRKKYYDK